MPFADADDDLDVDAWDFAGWQRCFTGSGGGVPADCECFNRDADNDIDGGDFTEFANCVTGSTVTWSEALTPACTPGDGTLP